MFAFLEARKLIHQGLFSILSWNSFGNTCSGRSNTSPMDFLCILFCLMLFIVICLTQLCLPRHLYRLGGSRSTHWPAGGNVAEAKPRPALQLLAAQTHHEHQADSAPWVGPLPVPLRPLQVVRVVGLQGPGDLPGGSEQGKGPNVARRRTDLLL